MVIKTEYPFPGCPWHYVKFLSHYANKFGIVEAILIEELRVQILNNLSREYKDAFFYNGRYYIKYNESIGATWMDFYISENKISNGMKKLVKEGFLIKERFKKEFEDGYVIWFFAYAFYYQKEVLGIEVDPKKTGTPSEQVTQLS